MQRMIKNSRGDQWLKKPLLSDQYQPWLINHHSLTLRLQARYQDFNVTPLMVAYAKAHQDEIMRLKIRSHTQVLIRNVFLNGHQHPVVFAHSVIPKKALRGQWVGLKNLGIKPLGASLFSNPKVKRTQLRYKKISRNHPLRKVMEKYCASLPTALWARRSVFSYENTHIMVTEVFLPNILNPI